MMQPWERQILNTKKQLNNYKIQRLAQVVSLNLSNGTYAIKFSEGSTAGNVPSESFDIKYREGDWVTVMDANGSWTILGQAPNSSGNL